jgi:hypothetical protein
LWATRRCPLPRLDEIAQTSGLPVRKLRYVLDHRLLPGAQHASLGRGVSRSFTPFESFAIVVAALMLEAGLRRSLICDCLAVLSRNPTRNVQHVPLYRAFAHGQPARLEIGDWKFVRLNVAPHPLSPALDTGWLALTDDPSPDHSYSPLVCVVLDVGRIRRLIPRS